MQLFPGARTHGAGGRAGSKQGSKPTRNIHLMEEGVKKQDSKGKWLVRFHKYLERIKIHFKGQVLTPPLKEKLICEIIGNFQQVTTC